MLIIPNIIFTFYKIFLKCEESFNKKEDIRNKKNVE